MAAVKRSERERNKVVGMVFKVRRDWGVGSAGAGREGRRWLLGLVVCVHGRYAVPSTSRNLHEGICVKCTKMKIVKSYALGVYRDFCHVKL